MRERESEGGTRRSQSVRFTWGENVSTSPSQPIADESSVSKTATMNQLFCFAAVLGLSVCPSRAEPVAQLTGELQARRKAADNWFKGELSKIALRAKTDDERRKILTACDWVWDAGKAGVTSITLNENGSGIHHYQEQTFAWTSTGWTVKIISPTGASAEITFDPGTLKYKGKDFDGKNTVRGSPKLKP